MPYPPLGSLILGSSISENKFEVHFFDSMVANDVSELSEKIDKIKPDIVILYDDEFNYLTKMSLFNMRLHCFDVLNYCMENDIPTLVYSSDAIDHPEIYLENEATVVIKGEGESVTLKLLDHYLKTQQFRELSGINGIVFRTNNNIVITENLPLNPYLDELPFPNYKKFVDIEKYRRIWMENHGYFSLNISTSRGCTYGCNWCAKPLWGRTYNNLSPKRVVQEMKIIQDELKADHIWITDDIFGLKKGWLEEFSNEYTKEGLSIPYRCLSRADLLIRGKTLEYLKLTNCQEIWIGAESGSQKILDAMEKGTTVEQISLATTMAKDQGIEISYFIQFGYLGENWEDILKTRNLILENLPSNIGISVSYPLPGTKFFKLVENQMINKKKWIDSSDLDMLFHGTYKREFYPILHQLVHNEFRLEKARDEKNLVKIIYHSVWFHYWRLKIRKYSKPTSYSLSLMH